MEALLARMLLNLSHQRRKDKANRCAGGNKFMEKSLWLTSGGIEICVELDICIHVSIVGAGIGYP